MIPILLTGLYAFADIHDLPPVTVVGEREDGGSLVCMSGACLSSAQEESARMFAEYLRMYDTFPQEDLPLNGARFCQTLASKQPQGCSLSQPPASPGIPVPGQAAWQPNGCGIGPSKNWFLSQIVGLGYGSVYTGDLNAPYPGVSFENACDAHDGCWGSGSDRTWCDISFQSDMNTACEAVTNTSGWGACRGLSSAYHAAVSTDAAGDHYDSTLADRLCALWAMDMRQNECAL